MTPEEIQALIQASLDKSLPAIIKGAFGELQSHFSEQLKPISERLSAFEVATEPKDPQDSTELPQSNDPAFQALTKRLAKLEADNKALADKEQQRAKEAEQLHFDNTLGKSLASKGNVLHQDLVTEILATRLRNGAVQKDGEWYTKDGAKLSEAVESFFGSEQGLHFLPSKHQNGINTPLTRQPASSGKVDPKDLSVDDMLEDMSF